jgi:drug/metabolite transporter (DMT)-like permease
MATGLTTLLQGLGQKVLSGPQAAIIFTLEPVFAAIFAFILLGERLGVRGWVGSVLVLAAMLLAELGKEPEIRRERETELAAPRP